MKTVVFFLGLCFGTFTLSAQYHYPSTPKIEVNDTLWGTIYKDNFRWLEDMKDPKVVDWFKQQAQLCDSVMHTISGREELMKEWRQLDLLQPEGYFPPLEANGRYFFQKMNPNDYVSKVYYRESMDKEDILLFDPVTFIEGKTLSIESMKPSYDGKKLLIGYSEQGAERPTLRVIDIDTKKMLPDVISGTLGAGDWSFDNNSFLYSWIKPGDITELDAQLNTKYKLHKLGTDVSSDIDFFSNESYPSMNIAPNEDPYVFLSIDAKDYIFSGKSNVQPELNLYYAPIDEFNSGAIKWKTLCKPEDELVGHIEFFDDQMYAMTYRDAENYKIVSTSLKNPDWNTAEVIAPENTMSLKSFARCKDYLLMVYTDGISSKLFKYNPKTKKTSEIKLPFNGSVGAKRWDSESNNFLVATSSWNMPYSEFLYNAATDKFAESPLNEHRVFPEFYKNLIVEEVEVKGHDGVMIPLSIIYTKGIKKDGSNVCVMQGYGAYGKSLRPRFDSQLNSLAVKGAIIAIPHVRGGGEKGREWYQAGFKTTKPNTWKDFISCAEYLIAEGFTRSEKLGGIGSSAGGILISRAITERPDLFAAAVNNVGIGNAMRMEFTANGPANTPEFGTVKDSIESKALYEMDGMQHVKQGVKYPAVMCVAGWNDPRVVAWQPGKLAAALQNASSSEKPILMKVNYDSGHGTEDLEVSYADSANQYAFLMWQCGHPDFQVKKSK